MDKGRIHQLIGIVYMYAGAIYVNGLNIGQRKSVTRIFYNEDTDTLQFFVGDADKGEYVEEVFPTEEEMERIFYKVVSEFL